MTDAIVCDRCGDAIPREEWEKHVHGIVEISYVESASTGDYERGPVELDLCGDCTEWLDEECGGPTPESWDWWSERSKGE